MLEDAVRLGHLTANPWRHVRVRAGDPSERRAYVPVADVQRVIDHCPNAWWKLLVALARFAGLRVPSEALSLTWGDVDFDRGRLSVPSPKTEYTGKTHRVIPLFPLLRPHLDAAWDQTQEGDVFIFPEEYRRRSQGPGGWANANLRTTLTKVIRRAGVEPWPRLWHSMRASCESDLAQSFPLAVVTKWLGNTPSVALRHYVDPTEAAYDQARTWTPGGSGAKSGAPEAQNPAQHAPADDRTESQTGPENADGEAGYASPCDVVRDTAQLYIGGAGN
jgi:integrase